MPASPLRGYGQIDLHLSTDLERGQCRKTGKANLRLVCQSQFHGLASACAVLLSHVWSVRVVEKSDFAHARARVRNPLDKVLRKCIDSAFFGFSARAGLLFLNQVVLALAP